jgi:predicted thioesterase
MGKKGKTKVKVREDSGEDKKSEPTRQKVVVDRKKLRD